jgi:hypothetical protein
MKSNNKYFLLIMLFSLAMQNLSAQLFKVQMVLSARPTSLLADWPNHPEILNYIVTYTGGPVAGNYATKIIATYKDASGNIIGSTDLNLVPNHIFSPGISILQSRDAVLLQCMRFTGNIQRTINATGKLPQGSYQLALQLIDAQTLQPLTAEIFRPFTVMGYQLPILLHPQDKMVLDAAQARVAITFRWTPISPAPPPTTTQTQTTYLLQIFEILPGQTPMQAFRSNQPILNKEILGATQYIWQPQLYLAGSSENRKLIWTIQTPDSQNTGYNNGVGDGRSEPFWFEIKSAKEILDDRKNSKN